MAIAEIHLKRLLSDIDYTLSSNCNKLSRLYIMSTPYNAKEIAYLEGQIDALIDIKKRIGLEVNSCQNT